MYEDAVEELALFFLIRSQLNAISLGGLHNRENDYLIESEVNNVRNEQ
jgi:hypothetical protein